MALMGEVWLWETDTPGALGQEGPWRKEPGKDADVRPLLGRPESLGVMLGWFFGGISSSLPSDSCRDYCANATSCCEGTRLRKGEACWLKDHLGFHTSGDARIQVGGSPLLAGPRWGMTLGSWEGAMEHGGPTSGT